MRKATICVVVPLLILVIAGCGDDSSETPSESSKEPNPKIVKGLSGDTYMNTKFGLRISNLPVDKWTVKALGSEGQGMLLQPELGFINLYSLLIMEPVLAYEFVGPDEKGFLDPIYEAGIPFIWVAADYEKGMNVETHQLSERMDRYAIMWSYEMESKEAVYAGNCSGIKAVMCRDDWKEALTWFAKGEVEVRCEYAAPEAEFDKYYVSYCQMLGDIWLLGK